MGNAVNAETGCRYLGEYVDEAELPPNAVYSRSEVVRPSFLLSYVDLWSEGDGSRNFTVLLKDGRTVTVRGHALKQWPPTVPGDSGSYGIVIRSASEEVIVALFRIGEVVGVFHGELQPERKVA
jgi:hypothetical protein